MSTILGASQTSLHKARPAGRKQKSFSLVFELISHKESLSGCARLCAMGGGRGQINATYSEFHRKHPPHRTPLTNPRDGAD